MTLRWRLFLSSLLVLAITLGVITVAFVLILRTRPAPPTPTYQRLAALAQGIDVPNIARRAVMQDELGSIAAERGVRVLLVDMRRSLVTYDSAGAFVPGSRIELQADVYTLPPPLQRGNPGTSGLFGNFVDHQNGPVWLFVALEVVRSGFAANAVVLAEEQGQQSLQDALVDFTGVLLPLLCQAGAVGGIIALLLADGISRTVARPLQGVAQAAAGMASGNYNERVPVTGPPEVRAVAAAFNNMGAQVQSTQKAQQDFLANVSHDLKTPLTSIQGYSQAIIDGAARNPVAAAQIIHEEAARLNRMVVELTDLARLQAGRMSMRWSSVDMAQLTNAIGERLQIMAQEKFITMQVDARPVGEVIGDGDRLAQVLTNLISNAIKYTPPGGKVWIATRSAEGGIHIVVKDTGVGITPEDQARIFERFYQVDEARGPGRGTGLGLAIVNEIVHAHSGKISVFSDGKGKGSTFTVWLPLQQASTIVKRR
jgi:signal transduction histidine kinase